MKGSEGIIGILTRYANWTPPCKKAFTTETSVILSRKSKMDKQVTTTLVSIISIFGGVNANLIDKSHNPAFSNCICKKYRLIIKNKNGFQKGKNTHNICVILNSGKIKRGRCKQTSYDSYCPYESFRKIDLKNAKRPSKRVKFNKSPHWRCGKKSNRPSRDDRRCSRRNTDARQGRYR